MTSTIIPFPRRDNAREAAYHAAVRRLEEQVCESALDHMVAYYPQTVDGPPEKVAFYIRHLAADFLEVAAIRQRRMIASDKASGALQPR